MLFSLLVSCSPSEKKYRIGVSQCSDDIWRDKQNSSWRIFGNAYVDIMPIKGLTLKSNIGIEHVQFLNKTLTRNVRPSDISSNRAVNRGYGQGDTWTWTNTANYLLDINGVHHFSRSSWSDWA